MQRKHKMLEGLGCYVGKTMFLELRGGTPLVRSRREIALEGRVIAFSAGKITLEICLEDLASISEVPITRAQRRKEERAGRA